MAKRLELVVLEQVVDRDGALMLDIGPGAPDRFLVDLDGDETMRTGRRLGHGGAALKCAAKLRDEVSRSLLLKGGGLGWGSPSIS